MGRERAAKRKVDDVTLQVTQYLFQYELRPNAYLLLNTLTGAMDVVEERLHRLLTPRAPLDPATLPPEEAEMLIARGYLVPPNEDRTRVAQWLAEFKDKLRSWHFIVCPTFTCNLRCPYCYEDLAIRQSKTAQTPTQTDHMFAAMDRFVEERGAKFVDVEMYGGEPFLRVHRNTVESIMRRSVERGWMLSGITNATQLDAYLDLFKEFGSHVKQLQITMDGPQEVHDRLRINSAGRGTYHEICRNVSSVLELGVGVVLRVNTGVDNVSHLPRMFEAFEQMGWTKHEHFVCMLAPITDHKCTGCVANYQPEFRLLTQLHELFPDWEATRDRYHVSMGYDIERRTHLLRQGIFGKAPRTITDKNLAGCSASNQHYVVFGADGNLYSCPETVGIPEQAIGRYTPELVVDRKRWSKWELNIANTPKCASCSIAPVCGGACPWQGVNSSSFDAYVPHCNYAKQTLNTYLDLNKHHLLKLLDA